MREVPVVAVTCPSLPERGRAEPWLSWARAAEGAAATAQPVMGTSGLCRSGDCETLGDPSLSPGLQGPGRWHRELPARGGWVCGCAPGSVLTQLNHVLLRRSAGPVLLLFGRSIAAIRQPQNAAFDRGTLVPKGAAGSPGCLCRVQRREEASAALRSGSFHPPCT